MGDLLGKTPLRLPFSLTIGYSSKRGLVLEGGPGVPRVPAASEREGERHGHEGDRGGPSGSEQKQAAAIVFLGRGPGLPVRTRLRRHGAEG